MPFRARRVKGQPRIRRERPGDPVLAFGLVAAILPTADVLIARRWLRPRILRVLLDVMIHSLFGLFVVLPFLTGLRRSRKRVLVWGAVLGGAVALDLDHFVAARSFRLRDAASLSSRPATHSLTFGALAGGLAALPSRQVVVAWMTFAVLASHVVRDAFSGQTPWLWPLSTRAIPQWSYYTLELLLFGISYFFRARGWRIAPLRDMITD